MPCDWRAAASFLENVSPEWRRRKLAPVAEVTHVSPAPLAQDTILVDGATIRRLASEQLRAERGEADIDDATLARRARLVSLIARPSPVRTAPSHGHSVGARHPGAAPGGVRPS